MKLTSSRVVIEHMLIFFVYTALKIFLLRYDRSLSKINQPVHFFFNIEWRKRCWDHWITNSHFGIRWNYHFWTNLG